MNRFKNRIQNFCKERAEQAIQPAIRKAKDISYSSLSSVSKQLLRKIAEDSINNQEIAPESYRDIVQKVFGSDSGRISSDMRVPLIIAGIFMSKNEWISFHSFYVDSHMKYYNVATNSISKAYVESFVEVAKEQRKKASKAEKSLLNTNEYNFSDTSDEYED